MHCGLSSLVLHTAVRVLLISSDWLSAQAQGLTSLLQHVPRKPLAHVILLCDLTWNEMNIRRDRKGKDRIWGERRR